MSKPEAGQPPHGGLCDDPVVRHFLEHYRYPNFYRLRKCGMCGYTCGYFVDHTGGLFYDSGCDCIMGRGPNIEPRGWQSLVDFFNANDSLRDLLTAFNIDGLGKTNDLGGTERFSAAKGSTAAGPKPAGADEE